MTVRVATAQGQRVGVIKQEHRQLEKERDRLTNN